MWDLTDNAFEIGALKTSLHQTFAIKDLGKLKYFLGIKMAISQQGLFLNQLKYVMDLLEEARFTDYKPVVTPIDSKLKLTIDGKTLKNVTYYRRLIGKFIYLTIIRPDITFAVSLVSQFMHAPTVEHLNIVKRIIRYLKGSINRGILMCNNHSTEIHAYTDADWVGNAINRKSTTSYCTFVEGNIVTWKSKKQQVIARSSAEAEYRAMAATACELIWLKSLLFDLGFLSTTPMSLMCDNQAPMHIATNPIFMKRPNLLKLTVTSSGLKFSLNSSKRSSLAVMINWRTCSLSPFSSVHFQRLLGKLG
ncbi:uncharacterized mitochondrial protein AtMg00810-like [Pyrus x bretschneideri]|uniref:uncharacterized mitochondrial protein AtMg00810-like n=1 Tax=Pyrus x bretschneideri TaxID=225117 RepID=UPI00202F3ADB|nr:uncharacterized mitochondrial protein AtMg00810-like [Pyrus x bretschneideri]